MAESIFPDLSSFNTERAGVLEHSVNDNSCCLNFWIFKKTARYIYTELPLTKLNCSMVGCPPLRNYTCLRRPEEETPRRQDPVLLRVFYRREASERRSKTRRPNNSVVRKSNENGNAKDLKKSK